MAKAPSHPVVFETLLKKLFPQGGNDGNLVSASHFQRTLKSMNLRFGTPLVDKLMLLCHINERGAVDITRLIEVIAISQGTVQKDEFGLASSPTLKSEMRTMSQAERVKRLAKDIHALFYKFDSGNGSLDEFRANLARLGIVETNETRRLLRQTPVSFRALLHSLTQTQNALPGSTQAGAGVQRTQASSTAINLFGHYDSSHMSRKGRGGAHDFAAHLMHDSDVITWDKRAPKKEGKHHKGSGEFHQDHSESHFAIRMDGQKIPVLYTTDVADMMRETDDHHFETTQQEDSARALQQKGLPITSSGYHTKDKGLIREQIYSCVRQLDQGRLTAKSFRQRLTCLGVGMPPEAKRLLSMYEANGRVDFTKFVRSFEDYLNTHTIHCHLDVATGDMGQDPITRHHKGHMFQRRPVASTNHGDIISWQATESGEKSPMHHAKVAFERKLHDLGDSNKNILAWKDSKEKLERPRQQRGPGTPHPSNHSDVITWEGGSMGARDAAPVRAKAGSQIGYELQSKACPFGTSIDMSRVASGNVQVTGSRKMLVGPRRCPTGQWFAPPQRTVSTHHKRFLRNQSCEDHIGVGCTVQAPSPHHGKKQFDGGAHQKVDHLGGTSAASSGGGEAQYMHHKKMFAQRAYAPDNVEIASSSYN